MTYFSVMPGSALGWGETPLAGANIVLSAVLRPLAVLAGHAEASALNQLRGT
jgi:membrane associated rhomboid family serine protease